MTRSRRRIVRIALLLGILTAPGWMLAQQRGNNAFPGGPIPTAPFDPRRR